MAKQSQEAAIMVTGGSGFIGQHLVRQLAEGGRTIVSLYYHRLPESLDNVYPVCSDMSSAELMLAPLRGVETVVHLAWEGGLAGPEVDLPWPPRSDAPPTRNLQMLANLVTAMERAGTKRLIFSSALGARFDAQTPFLREKYYAEHIILNSRVPEKVILRSAVVWAGPGTEDPFLRSILRVMKYPIYPVPSHKDGLAPVHVKDVAQTLVRACTVQLKDPARDNANHSRAKASIIEVDGGESLRVDELFKIVSESYVKKARFPLGGFLGDSLLPLFERDPKNGQKTPKLRHFLALGGCRADASSQESPGAAVLPATPASFRGHRT